MRRASGLEPILRRDRRLALLFLAMLWVFASVYLLNSGAMDTSMQGMSREPASHLVAAGMLVGMWWAMMVAMMVPGAAPIVLLFCAVHRRAEAGGTLQGPPPVAAFVLGYLAIWFAFSLAASAVQWALSGSTIFSADRMAIEAKWLAAALLLVAGAYQISPMKQACLAHCRAPASFLAEHWRPGAMGAIRLGILHGAYCLGCCWALMLLLFVGGVMNIGWIVLLSTLALGERLSPGSGVVRRIIGAGLLAAGLGVALA
jgi:predicted metal-binding membrane protein